jgi:hypothetical protein
MVLDAVRGYLQLASGLTEVSVQRATATAKALLASAGADQALLDGVSQTATEQAARGQAIVGQIAALADDIVATSKANRELLIGLVRAEVVRAVGGLGLVSADDLKTVERRVDRLEAATPKKSRTPRAAAPKKRPVKSPAKARRAPAKKSATRSKG